MRATFSAFGLLLILSGMHVPASQAQGHRPAEEKPAALLRSLRQNALDASANADIYQWKRVNREVDRIAANAHKLAASTSPTVSPIVTRRNQELQQAVSDLRAARLQRHAERISEAAQRLIALCDALMAP